jgi:hypothetical protein
MKNTWTECKGVRVSQGRIVTADGTLGGRIVWPKYQVVGSWLDGSSRHRIWLPAVAPAFYVNVIPTL